MDNEQKKIVTQLRGFDKDHYTRSDQYANQVNALVNSAATEYAQLAGTLFQPDPNKPFSFDDYPQTKAKASAIAHDLAGKIKAVVTTGTREEWAAACDKNDAFIKSIVHTSRLTTEEAAQYQGRNLEALSSFQRRKVQGMGLSARVWQATKQIQGTIELGIDVGLGEGRSAQQLSRDIRECLNEPHKLFRRVKDKYGNLQLSKAAKLYHPGRGVYRSAAQNAMRLARTEINMAYRQAEFIRWQNLDFVVGFRVCLSNNHTILDSKGKPIPLEDICDELAGDYPKGFKFVGWHPNCRCYVIPILSDYDEYNKERAGRLRAIVQGIKYKAMPSRKTVTAMPEKFTKYIERIEKRAEGWSSMPYFIRDNFVGGKISGGLNPGITSKINGQSQEKPVIKNNSNPCTEFDGEIAQFKKWAFALGLDVNRLDALRMAGDRAALEAEVDRLQTLSFERLNAWSAAETELIKERNTAKSLHFDEVYLKYSTAVNDNMTSEKRYYADCIKNLQEATAQIRIDIEKAKEAEKKADYSKLMPDELKIGGKHLDGTKYKFAKDFFDKLKYKPKLEMPGTNKGSYETEHGGKVVLDNAERAKASEWEKKSVVYHEFGHAIADQRDIIWGNADLVKLREGMIKRLRTKGKAAMEVSEWDCQKYEWVRHFETKTVMRAKVIEQQLLRFGRAVKKMKPETFKKRGITRDDLIEQICSTADTLKSLVRSTGWGHSDEYFKSTFLSRHEFMAHCFENTYLGNEVFKAIMPQEYEEMIAFIKSLPY